MGTENGICPSTGELCPMRQEYADFYNMYRDKYEKVARQQRGVIGKVERFLSTVSFTPIILGDREAPVDRVAREMSSDLREMEGRLALQCTAEITGNCAIHESLKEEALHG